MNLGHWARVHLGNATTCTYVSSIQFAQAGPDGGRIGNAISERTPVSWVISAISPFG
jgi:hypothetical protein